MSTRVWNVTVDDTSPVLTYHPFSEGYKPLDGWQLVYTGTGVNTRPGEPGSGNSSHVTALSGASFVLPFYGSALYLYGASNASYEVVIDAQPPISFGQSSGDLLYSVTDLDSEAHFVVLTAQSTNNGTTLLSFDHAIISVSLVGVQLQPIPMVYNSSNATLEFVGNWTDSTNSKTTSTAGSFVSLSFTNALAAAVDGALDFGNSIYNVSLTGQQTMTGNSSSLWLADQTLLFLQCGLDPNVKYNITLTVNDSSPFSFDSFTVYQQITAGVTNAPPPPHRNNQAGVIAGSVISGLVLLSLVGCCCACYLRSRTYTMPRIPRWTTKPDATIPVMTQGLRYPVAPPDHQPIPHHHGGFWASYENAVPTSRSRSGSSSETDSPTIVSPPLPPITIQASVPPWSHDRPVVAPSPTSFSDNHFARINQDLPPLPDVRGRSRTPQPVVIISRSRTPSHSPVRPPWPDAREVSHSNLAASGSGLRQGGRGSVSSTPSTRTVNTPVDPPAITLAPWASPNNTRPMIYQHLRTLLIAQVSPHGIFPNEKHLKYLQNLGENIRSLSSISSLIYSEACRLKLLKIVSRLSIPDHPNIREALEKDSFDIADILGGILQSDTEQSEVLNLRDGQAESFMNAIQCILDKGLFPNFAGSSFSSLAHQLLARLSEACDKLPSSLYITGVIVHETEPRFSGGFADIYRATYNGRKVALKRLRVFRNAQHREENHRKLGREALVWRQLKHPFVLPFLGIDSESFPRAHCMVSPWMKHGTILSYIKDNKPANNKIEQHIREIAQGLEYLHSQNVIHGDLRGVNILVNKQRQACLADFGLTTFSDLGTATATSNQHGSVRWMAPELLEPTRFGLTKSRRTPATDVYSFACVCVEIYTGKEPFHEIDHNISVTFQVLQYARPTRPLENPMPSRLWNLVELCWSQQFSDRLTIGDVVERMRIEELGDNKFTEV